MGSLSSKNRGVKYSLCAINAFTKYAWVKPLNNKKAKTVLHGCSYLRYLNKLVDKTIMLIIILLVINLLMLIILLLLKKLNRVTKLPNLKLVIDSE